MSEGLNASISLGINNGCPMEFTVLRGGRVIGFWIYHDTEEVDVSIEVDAFEELLELGASALAEAKAQLAAPSADSAES